MGSKVSQKFDEHHLVTDLGIELPSGFSEATVTYGDLKVSPGKKITPTQNRDKPTVSWEAHSFVFYTLIMTDVDVTLGNEKMEIKHWLVTNIPGNEVEKGHETTGYMPAAPSLETGSHRYAFLVYRQKEKLPEEPKVTRFELKGRAPFKTAQYALENELAGPIAGNFFLAEYDESVPEFHKSFLKFPYVFSNIYNLMALKVSRIVNSYT